jgi:hypothetical protein
VGGRCIPGCSVSFNGLSAPWVRTVRAPRGLSAGASRTVRAYHAPVGPRSRMSKVCCLPSRSQTERRPLLSIFLALSLRKVSLLGDFDSSTSRTVRAYPRTLREVLHHVIRVFFRIPHSFSRILSKKVIRVWGCDLKFVNDFKILAW